MAKAPDAFRTISEAAEDLGVPQHVLRFWETKFSFITPLKRAGGRRFYRPQDLAVLRGIRRLLHDEGLTIRGVQRLYRTQGLKALIGAGEGVIPSLVGVEEVDPAPETARPAGPLDLNRLQVVLGALEGARRRLDTAIARAEGR